MGKMSPMKIAFTYDEKIAAKSFKLLYSYDNLKPSQESCNGQMYNPELLELRSGHQDPKTGKEYFDREWLFITLQNLDPKDVRVNLFVTFKAAQK